jgi:hypothetical protein
MPKFTDGCSCRVWAIDGWVNEEQAKALNELIIAKGTSMYDAKFKGNRHDKVQEFVNLRTVTSSALDCVIYGEFDSAADKLPTHMWLEYNGYIYDTIPGFALRRKVANDESRYSPGCVDGSYTKTKVGNVAVKLSTAQLKIIGDAKDHWAAVSGKSCDQFTPPD